MLSELEQMQPLLFSAANAALGLAGGLVGEAAESPHPVGNGKGKAAADVRRMSTAGQQQLADFAWLLIQVSLDKPAAVNPYVDVQEVD